MSRTLECDIVEPARRWRSSNGYVERGRSISRGLPGYRAPFEFPGDSGKRKKAFEVDHVEALTLLTTDSLIMDTRLSIGGQSPPYGKAGQRPRGRQVIDLLYWDTSYHVTATKYA